MKIIKPLQFARSAAHHGEMNDWQPAAIEWVRCVRTVHFKRDGGSVTVQCQDTFGHEGRCTVIDPATFEAMLVPEGATW
jgi:hypothetical protein